MTSCDKGVMVQGTAKPIGTSGARGRYRAVCFQVPSAAQNLGRSLTRCAGSGSLRNGEKKSRSTWSARLSLLSHELLG